MRVEPIPDALADIVDRLVSWPMTEAAAARLPRPGAWSAITEVLSEMGHRRRVCFPPLQRAVRRAIVARAQRKGLLRRLRPPPPPPGDPAAMIQAMIAACSAAGIDEPCPGLITGATGAAHPFDLSVFYALHQEHCGRCRARPFETHVVGRSPNEVPCYIGALLCLMQGWRLPLRSPPPRWRRRGDNYATLDLALRFAPASMAGSLDKLKTTVLRPLQPDEPPPTLISPMLVVLKQGDLLGAEVALKELGAPLRGFSPRLGDESEAAQTYHFGWLDALNAHIRSVVAAQPEASAVLGLKPIKPRVCTSLKVLNKHSVDVSFSYFGPYDAVLIFEEEGGKMDLDAYFWSFPAHPADATILGVELEGSLYVARRAQFGGKLYPWLANAVMAEFRVVARCRGMPMIFYTDDVFTTGGAGDGPADRTSWAAAAAQSDGRACWARMGRLQQMIESVGLVFNASKSVGPAKILTFLGLEIDSVRQRIHLPDDKVKHYLAVVRWVLAQPHVPRKVLESLEGRLLWASHVIVGGLVRVARLRHQRRFSRGVSQRLWRGVREDLRWWERTLLRGLRSRDGCWAPFWLHGVPQPTRVISDSSGDEAQGFGLVYDGRLSQGFWRHTGVEHSSAYRELVPVLLALHLRVHTPRYRRAPAPSPVMVFATDNASVAIAINKGSCKDARSDAYPLLRTIFDLAASARPAPLYLLADWVPRGLNTAMDDVSKGVRL